MARAFNGTTDYIELGTGIRGTDVFKITVGAWIYLNTNNAEHTVIGRWDNTLNESWLLAITNTGHTLFVILATDSNAYGATGATVLSTGTWYHVGGTYDGATVVTYVNGSVDASNTINKQMNNGLVTCRIGQHANSAYMDGRIAEVTIWLDTDNQALVFGALAEGASVSQLDGMILHAKIGYWPLLGDDPETDLSVGNPGTLHGTTYVDHPPVLSEMAFA